MRRAAVGRLVALALQVVVAAGCAASAGKDYDPLEGMNREIFWFNDKADEYVLEPVAQAWDWVVPNRVQQAIGDFFINMRFPINVGNDLMQARFRDSATHTARFLVNTTFGIGGLFDPASDWGLTTQEEDFGQTLGRWGVGPGPYLMLPILGPTTVRDASRFPVDGLLSGLWLAVDGYIITIASVGELVNFRARTLGTFEDAKAASLDYYSFVRNAYLQRRQALIEDSTGISTQASEDLYDVDQYEETPID
jgi:phospholipid-binding lipoprotein MlaA